MATPWLYSYLHTIALHDALPIWGFRRGAGRMRAVRFREDGRDRMRAVWRPVQGLFVHRLAARRRAARPGQGRLSGAALADEARAAGPRGGEQPALARGRGRSRRPPGGRVDPAGL